MTFDPKAYKKDVLVPLAKDQAASAAVDTAIRALSQGKGAAALAGLDSTALFAVDPADLGDLPSHFKQLGLALNKFGTMPPSADKVRRLLQASQSAGLTLEEPSFWHQQSADRAHAQAAQLDGFVENLKTENPLGVLTTEQLGRAAAAAGFGNIPAQTLNSAAEAKGLMVTHELTMPSSTVPPVLLKATGHAEFRTLLDLLTFPDLAADATFIDGLTSSGRPLTVGDVASALGQSERARDSSAVQDAQKTLGLLKKQCQDDTALHQLVLATVMKHLAGHVKPGGSRLQQRDALVGMGIGRADAARAVAFLNPSGAAGVRSAASLQISEALSAGKLAEARRLADSLSEDDDDRAERTSSLARLTAAESQKATLLSAYRTAWEARDFPEAERALNAAIRIDTEDPSLPQKLEEIPPARPGALQADIRGGVVHLSWSAVPGATSVVVRSEGTAPVSPGAGIPVGRGQDLLQLVDDGAPAGRHVGYSVFTTRDGRTFSDPATAQIAVLPVPSALVATTDSSQVELSWQLSPRALAAEVVQQNSDGTTTTHPVANGSVLTVKGLSLGVKYVFDVRAIYLTQQGREASQPARIEATPRGELAPAPDFSVQSVTMDGGSGVKASWHPVAGYEVEVWAFPRDYRALSGSIEPLAALRARGGVRLTPLVGQTGSAERAVRTYRAEGISVYVPVTLDGERGRLGEPVVSGAAPNIRDGVAERFGNAVKVSWVWPTGDYLMEVSWKKDGAPRSGRITPAKYRAGGGFMIPAVEGVGEIAVATIAKASDDEWASAPVPIPYTTARPALEYAVAIKKSLFAGPTVTATIDPRGFSGVLDVTLVVASGALMPATARSGDVIARQSLALDADGPAVLRASIPKLRSPYWVRLFVEDTAPVVLLDPPTSQMKG
ncbi:MAG: hypothetical protein L0H93_02080 [Nocardioides sp.]|nr:hypothetical protein [Nocardioides sp.]